MRGLPPIDAATALIIAQDGLTTGAIYALIALSLVLVFSVTRVIFVTEGVLVSFCALTLVKLEQGQVPGTVWVLLLLAAVCIFLEIVDGIRRRRIEGIAWKFALYALLPGCLAALTIWIAPGRPALVVAASLAIAIVTPMGAMIYRIAFQKIADASMLTLAFVAVAVLFVLQGATLLFFGAEGFRTPPFSNASVMVGPVNFSGQSLWIYATTLILLVLISLFFSKTLLGKALRATAVNRIGARLMGIPVAFTGMAAFSLAAFLAAFSGVLIAPTMTIYFDSGFLLVLKAIIGAVIGAMSVYGLAVIGSIGIGIVEAFALYFNSAFADAIVFMLLVPILLWQSLTLYKVEEDSE